MTALKLMEWFTKRSREERKEEGEEYNFSYWSTSSFEQYCTLQIFWSSQVHVDKERNMGTWDISFTDCTYNTRAPLAVQFHYIFNQCFCPMSSSTDDADELNMKVQPPQNGSNMGIQPKAFVFCICYFLVSRFVFCKALWADLYFVKLCEPIS